MARTRKIQHGTKSYYNGGKCRCDNCRAAAVLYTTQRMKRKREEFNLKYYGNKEGKDAPKSV